MTIIIVEERPTDWIAYPRDNHGIWAVDLSYRKAIEKLCHLLELDPEDIKIKVHGDNPSFEHRSVKLPKTDIVPGLYE